MAIREKYGRKVLLHGGVDKMALLKGPKAIEQELLRIKPVVEEGGFVPHVDHRCPADVTLENYKFYLKLKRRDVQRRRLEAALQRVTINGECERECS